MFEYKFVEIIIERNINTKRGESFKKCEEAIKKEAANGWRLVQVVIPPNEKIMGAIAAYAYEIIFEREKNRQDQ